MAVLDVPQEVGFVVVGALRVALVGRVEKHALGLVEGLAVYGSAAVANVLCSRPAGVEQDAVVLVVEALGWTDGWGWSKQSIDVLLCRSARFGRHH